MTKQDRLRTLARMGFEVAACHIKQEQFDVIKALHPDLAKRLGKLRRFMERNVDTNDIPDALDFDDLGAFDIESCKVNLRKTTFDAVVNGREYAGAFDIQYNKRSGDAPVLVDFVVWGPEATEYTTATESADQLLSEALETEVNKYFDESTQAEWVLRYGQD